MIDVTLSADSTQGAAVTVGSLNPDAVALVELLDPTDPTYRRTLVRVTLTHGHELTDWAFTTPDIQRLQLLIEPGNPGSWRTAEKCGFEREGLLRSWQLIGDTRRDMYSYGLIRTSLGVGGGA